jgi:DinB family protein
MSRPVDGAATGHGREPAWCRRLIAELQESDARARSLAETLTAQQLNWRPRPHEWSIGQCLEHLLITNTVYVPAIADALANRPHGSAEEITPGWFGRWFIRSYIEPSAETKRGRAPKKITPAADVDATILERFLESNQRARDLVQRAAPYDVNRIRFKNPFIGIIRFTVGTGLQIISRHERRHLLQAERVRASGGFP